MKHYKLINLCYRERMKPDADIHEIQIMAHSIHDAKIKFNAMQIRKQSQEYGNPAGKLKYVVLAGAIVR